MPTYILPTHQADENASSYIDFAMIHIDNQAKEWLTNFKRVRDQADQALYRAALEVTEGVHPELVWFNYWATYYGFYNDPVSDDWEKGSFTAGLDLALTDSRIIEATDEELDSLGLSHQRTEMDEIHVCHDGVYWTCCPRHMDVEVRTQILTWEQLGIE